MTANDHAQPQPAPVPPDDPNRALIVARPDDPRMPHIGLVGDTYTVLLAAKDTAGRYCLIDMHIPPGGGPPPHRHDFEETFVLLEGELEATFRGVKSMVKAGDTVHIPANAPHRFHNISDQPVRLLCIGSPAGLEDFFAQLGVPVAARTTAPPPLDPAAQLEFRTRAEALAPQFQTELLRDA